MIKNACYYVILPGHGRVPGIYDNWSDAEAQTKGHSGGTSHRVGSHEEALQRWQSAKPPYGASGCSITLWIGERATHLTLKGAIIGKILALLRTHGYLS